jgi:pimeloyl-ACP methyl ester carboxylesterase
MMEAAGLDGVVLSSGGFRILGALHRAAGVDPRPAVLLLHGIPGHEKNLDLAVDLRDRGVHCLHIHYRGSWGSGGEYALTNLVPDARVALEWLAVHPRVDPLRIALVGISLGGWVALTLASQADGVCAVAALSPLLDPRRLPLPLELAREFTPSLTGLSPEQLVRDWAVVPAIATLAPRLARMPILLVTADADEVFPPDHYANLPAALERLERVRFPRADHVYSDVRPGLRHVVCSWLLDQFEGIPPLTSRA